MKYASVKKYAELCGVTPKTISERIKAGKLSFSIKKIDNREYRYINVSKYPPAPDQRKLAKCPPFMA